MRLKFIRSISLILGVIALILITPAVCAASMGPMPAMDSSGSCPQQSSPAWHCFTTSSETLSHCVLVKAVGAQVKPARLISYTDVLLPVCPESPVEGNCAVPEMTYQHDTLTLPVSPPPEHHCRNTVGSEEPPL